MGGTGLRSREPEALVEQDATVIASSAGYRKDKRICCQCSARFPKREVGDLSCARSSRRRRRQTIGPRRQAASYKAAAAG